MMPITYIIFATKISERRDVNECVDQFKELDVCSHFSSGFLSIKQSLG